MPILDQIKNIRELLVKAAAKDNTISEEKITEFFDGLTFLKADNDLKNEQKKLAYEKYMADVLEYYTEYKNTKSIGALKLFSENLIKAEETFAKALMPTPKPHPVTVKAGADAINAIIKAYDEKYKDKTSGEYQKDCVAPEKRNDGSYLFTFPGLDEAKKFFETQAQGGLQFITKEDGKDYATGCNFYSCGDGVLYSGTSAQIVEQMEKSMKEHQSDPNKFAATQAGLGLFKSLVAQEKLKFEMKSITPAPSADPSLPTPPPSPSPSP